MTSTPRNSVRREFAATISRLGLTSLATSMLAMLYKLAMPRMLGTSGLAEFYFAETFPYLFFALVPLGIGNYIARDLAGNMPLARQSLTSIIGFEACAGAIAYSALMLTATWRYRDELRDITVLATMGIACLAVVFQQRILRPTFIALDAAKFVSRVELLARALLTTSILVSLLIAPKVIVIASLHAIFETSVVGIYLWSFLRRGWLSEPIRLSTIMRILKTSLPFSVVTMMMAVNGNVDSTLFRWLTDPREMGLYAATNRLGLIALFGVSVVFSSVLPMLGRILKQSPEEYDNIFNSVARLICCGGLPLTVIFTLLAPQVSHLLFGPEFAAAWRGLSLYGAYMLIVAMTMLLSSNLAIRASARTYASAIGCSLVLNITSAAIGIFIAYQYYGEGSAGAGRLLAGIGSDLISIAFFLRLTGEGSERPKILGPCLLAVAPALIIAILQMTGLISTWYQRGMILAFVPVYMVAAGLLRRRDVTLAVRIFKDFWSKAQQRSPVVT